MHFIARWKKAQKKHTRGVSTSNPQIHFTPQPIPEKALAESNNKIQNGRLYNCPTEILCSIFLYARDLAIFYDPHATIKRKPCEITISHVCKLWRSISLGYPQLWDTYRYSPHQSRIHINIDDGLSTYIRRSETQTLDIWFNFRGNYSRPWVDLHLNLFQVSLTVANRWRRFTLLSDANDSGTWHTACGEYLKNLHTPHLEHLAICSQTEGIPPDESVSIFNAQILTAGAPVLRSVWLDSTNFWFHMPPIHGRLTSLRIDKPSQHVNNVTISLRQFLRVVASSPLRNLSVSGINFFEDLSQGIQPVTMKTLAEFRCGSADVIELFQNISTPALETLILLGVNFPNLSKESVQSLTTLYLIDCAVSWAKFSTELSHVSSHITHLTVSSGNFWREFPLKAFKESLRHHWPSLRYVACNINGTRSNALHDFAALCSGHDRHRLPFTFRLHNNLIDAWEGLPAMLKLKKSCKLRGWDDDHPLLPYHWPYEEDRAKFGYDLMTDYDPYAIPSYE